jgi:hypothetical protein
MKYKSLLYDIRHLQIFGRYAGHVYTIDYQKHGLPHSHMLLFLHSDDRLLNFTTEYVDRAIRAEIPTKGMDLDGTLRDLVA